MKEIYFAGGCFWGVEKYLSCIPGVIQTKVGYANGQTDHPTYQQVCRENTGHAETVKVVYDEGALTLEDLLRLFYQAIDPTSINRQGNDAGAQYRTGVYYVDDLDRAVVASSLEALGKGYHKPIQVECLPLLQFFNAEEYHQGYLDKNPQGYCHLSPKLFEMAKQKKLKADR